MDTISNLSNESDENKSLYSTQIEPSVGSSSAIIKSTLPTPQTRKETTGYKILVKQYCCNSHWPLH